MLFGKHKKEKVKNEMTTVLEEEFGEIEYDEELGYIVL